MVVVWWLSLYDLDTGMTGFRFIMLGLKTVVLVYLDQTEDSKSFKRRLTFGYRTVPIVSPTRS